MEPIVLGPNQLHRFYKGGAAISALRGTPNDDDYAPEDWVGSTTAVFGSDSVGISTLPDGRLLSDAVAGQPEDFLGAEHVAAYGADPALLVKLLDAGERLPAHLHPDRAFARAHLGSRYGKTEAWIIADAQRDAAVHVGFAEDVPAQVLERWVAGQNRDALLGALNRRAVRAGDVLFVPAATPHAIGDGILIVEIQEPSDLSILLEWEGFAIDGPNQGHLGLGFDLALTAVDRSGWDAERLARLAAGRGETRPGVEALFPAAADAFFRAERIRPAPSSLPAAFSILVVTQGAGVLEAGARSIELTRGDTVLVPQAAGECRLSGDMVVLRCMPPGPDATVGRR
ncbi:MAG: class I mannose-6-phosphate isomerase [Actinomycetota bacterium]